ncbi:hypothetical protein Ddye_013291 [Dipteronia dyeriana]|uniref:Derlin n=1 Tax=Dipteronia dyeriana TaxID=168575 RepID=A0AAD9X619_9ROSI|nr:hypothetical protein Ddye_013291 [Dipteronia dyeriana]
MSTPAEYYRSLPPVSKFYGVTCLMTTTAYYLQLYHRWSIALSYEDVIKRFQVWRLVTNFFFLGAFSFPFAIRLIMIAKYGVSLERGPFDKRTADFVWMLIFGAFSLLFPNARINIYGVVSLKGFYLPWATLALDLIFGDPIKPGILGIVAGHLYYFLTLLHPLAAGKYIFNTPLWVHKVVAFWGEGTQINSPVQRDPHAGVAFRGRGYRLNGNRSTNTEQQQPQTDSTTPQQPNSAFRGRSYRLDARTYLSLSLYYPSLPPVSKFYGVTCLLTTTAYYLQLYHPWYIALSYEDVIKRFQVWRLVTNFFFLGGFSFPFDISLIMIHKVVAIWGVGNQINSPVQRDQYAGVAFQGRGYRLNGNRSTNTDQQQQPQTDGTTLQQPNADGGVTFRGTSHRLDANN